MSNVEPLKSRPTVTTRYRIDPVLYRLIQRVVKSLGYLGTIRLDLEAIGARCASDSDQRSTRKEQAR